MGRGDAIGLVICHKTNLFMQVQAEGIQRMQAQMQARMQAMLLTGSSKSVEASRQAQENSIRQYFIVVG